MIKRLIAIALIFSGTSVSWMVLGGATLFRASNMDNILGKKVGQIWGSRQTQNALEVRYYSKKSGNYNDRENIPLVGSDIQVKLDMEHRQKGLMWYAVYTVNFEALYTVKNTTGKTRTLELVFDFPSNSAIYDDFVFQPVGRGWYNQPQPSSGEVTGKLKLAPNEEVQMKVGYRSQGMQDWKYSFGGGVAQVKDFALLMETDFADIDFPTGSVSPTEKKRTKTGWQLNWTYSNLVTGVKIGMLLPEKIQPGPLAGRISLFAPVSLFFFMMVLLVLALISGVEVHPMHFFFLSAAFFAFHLLMSYLVDHISIHLAFAISAAVSVALVLSYLNRALTRGFALKATVVQLIYLVLFSYTFFFKGYTGLAITIGAVATLFVMMQLTAKVNWDQALVLKAQRK